MAWVIAVIYAKVSFPFLEKNLMIFASASLRWAKKYSRIPMCYDFRMSGRVYFKLPRKTGILDANGFGTISK